MQTGPHSHTRSWTTQYLAEQNRNIGYLWIKMVFNLAMQAKRKTFDITLYDECMDLFCFFPLYFVETMGDKAFAIALSWCFCIIFGFTESHNHRHTIPIAIASHVQFSEKFAFIWNGYMCNFSVWFAKRSIPKQRRVAKCAPVFI